MAETPIFPAIGAPAPDFDMPASKGRQVSLAAMRGKPFILYFYPKASTPGCTTEACDFQEALGALGSTGLPVIGVSRDSMKAIDTFATRQNLDFPLASDATGAVTEAYGVWVEKTLYGRKYMGIERATFLIDADGRVAQVWRNVKVPGHVAEVMRAASAL
ncbi:thioredoxin-dependent thiol peroxidase [Gluconacetobacter takamatsuzukensis]|uniref:thioredoxin-dependent peroxiredoxin n=1 Tax=Gluconacetobacter takamatsuzukensis TaxID=1286190 RepID=A0A7W4KDS6_9PROT|nr:thioredoxin-dependent thiol peroxidase [Gluconacetobacter takamatsuzukensis]MBB2205093.1 thioredoxin-dependent thiol peroxidase [Gluconacetobacter takamatsuzukensis]